MISQFRCPHCNRSYARETWWRKHMCEKKRRFELAHNMEFRRAWMAYQHWCKRQGFLPRRKKEIAAEDFLKSRYYNDFMNLAKFTGENWVITSLLYLDFLIDKHVPASRWTKEETLKAYRDDMRRSEDPISQTQTTCTVIRTWCKNHSIDRLEFFSKVTSGTALQMITTNQISPWVLFGYDRSREGLLKRMSDDWLCSIDQFLNNAYWINRLTGSADIASVIQAECERLFADE